MRAGLVGSTLGAVSAGEQNWYPIDMVGWFTEHVREGVEVTAGQLGLLAPALAEPYRLDDATVARIVRVHFDQAADLVLFQNQADRWNAMPRLGRPWLRGVSRAGADHVSCVVASRWTRETPA